MDTNEIIKKIENEEIILLTQGKKHAFISRIDSIGNTSYIHCEVGGSKFSFRFPEEYGTYFCFVDSALDKLANELAIEVKANSIKTRKEKQQQKQEKDSVSNNTKISKDVPRKIDVSPIGYYKPVIKKESQYRPPETKPSFTKPSNITTSRYDGNKKESNTDVHAADIGDVVLVLHEDNNERIKALLEKDGAVNEYNGVYFERKHLSNIDQALPDGMIHLQVSAPLGKAIYKQKEGYTFRLYLNNNFEHYKILKIAKENYSVESRLTVKSVIEKRGISELVHFSQIENFAAIMDWGALIPRSMHRELEITSYYSDPNRMENKLDCTSLSVSYPNTGMFYYKRLEASYAVISFDAMFLCSPDCTGFRFYNDNAAATRTQSGSSPEDFELMFSGNRPEGLDPKYATRYQAEILVEGFIPISYIKTIEVEDEEVKKRLLEIIKDPIYQKKVVVNKRFFNNNARRDIWKE